MKIYLKSEWIQRTRIFGLNIRSMALAICLLTVLSADAQETPGPWFFFPGAPQFNPLLSDPREPQTSIIAHTSLNRFEGAVGAQLEIIRYDNPYGTHWAAGLLGSGFILLDENGATFPERANDWLAGLYLSEQSGLFSHRLEFMHQSSHLGDSLEGLQEPIIYNGENFNYVCSFQPWENLRIYGGFGVWENLFPPDNAFFSPWGLEVFSPPWGFIGTSMRGYGACHLEWKGQAGGHWDESFQWGVQWKWKKTEPRAFRLALVYYDGNYQFGQYYLQHDTHFGIGIYFDP